MMTKPGLGRLPRVAVLVALGGILLLTARIAAPTFEIAEPTASRRIADLVSCVPPAPLVDPSAAPSSVPDAIPPECDGFSHDPLPLPRMTAC
jgi:hypothetical protein